MSFLSKMTWTAGIVVVLWFAGATRAYASPSSSLDEGARLVALDDEGREKPFSPLQTDVSAELTAGYASVVVTTTFRNPYEDPLEATYRFPLPPNAAVTSVAMIVGGQLIESEIAERQQAVETYEAARDEGRRASLVEQLRPNVFQQSLANVMPGEVVHVALHFAAPLQLDDGEYVFAMPSVVGPRYSGGASSHRNARDAEVNPNFLPPSAADPSRPEAHRLSVSARIETAVPLFGVHSPSHAVDVDLKSPRKGWVQLSDADTMANRTFELRYRTATAEAQSGLIAHRRPGEAGVLAMTLEPPPLDAPGESMPKEMVFVVDTSGSMMGDPMEKVRASIRFALDNMGPDDTFQIVNFADTAEAMAPNPLANTPENRARGYAYLEGLAGSGGTDMMSGVRRSLDVPEDPSRLRIVLFMTDGYIGNEEDVLSQVGARLGGARLFSFGVGDEVNRYLLERLARVGRGAVQYVSTTDAERDVIEKFYWRIAHPVLTDIEVDWGGLDVVETSPSPVADLYAGQPLRLFGRFKNSGKAVATVRGRTASGPVEWKMPVELPDIEPKHAVIETMWARQRVADWMDEEQVNPSEELAEKILDYGLTYRLLTPYTAFVAVERDIVANADPAALRQALAAVHLPTGMQAEGVFGEQKRKPGQLSPYSIKPGDPEILVHAPRDAARVVAVLPWGQPVECTWEPIHEAWLGRFLVPREADEGRYRVRVFIVGRDGSVDSLSLSYEVDATAPALLVDRIEDAVEAGSAVSLRAHLPEVAQQQPSTSGVTTRVRVRLDVRRAVARIGDSEITLQPSDDGSLFSGEIPIPSDLASGRHTIELSVTDLANNLYQSEVELWVR